MNIRLVAALVLFGISQSSYALPPTDPTELKAPRPGAVPGYMAENALIDSVALVPPPPAAGSPAQAGDDAVYQASKKLKDSPRWQLAARDAVLAFPKAADTFSCALGVPITAAATPNLNMLMRRVQEDARLVARPVKDLYNRRRPFLAGNDAICTPAEAVRLRDEGSYPSGHTSVGWTWGLVLSEVAPDHANALMQRAVAFGQSRAVCGVHWQSDVEASKVLASALFSQLQSNADFLAQLGEARKEVAVERAKGLTPTADCAADQKALEKAAP